MPGRASQQDLPLRDAPTWGGRRTGAGRPARAGRGGAVPHDRRERFSPAHPAHVTLRFLPHVWNLRARRCYAVLERSLQAAASPGFQVVHHSVQGDHAHLIVEATDAVALAAGMKGLKVRIARGLNRMMARDGAVFSDRYHLHPLRSPAEVRRALCYVLQNFRRHARERGETLASSWVDPCSSAGSFDGWAGREPAAEGPVPRTWLLRTGWKRHGLIATGEVPGTRRPRLVEDVG